MKKLYFLFAGLIMLTFQLKAQAPNSLNYQGVARDATGAILSGQNISLRFTIHQGSAGGAIVYQETKAAATNQLGLFTVAIGSGVVVSGTFATIGWSTNTEFLQVEMDPTGGSSYLNMGTNQFLSVPYSISSGSAASSWNLTGNSSTNGTDYIGTTDNSDLVFKTAGNENVRISNSTGNVGINTPTAKNILDVNGSEAIGTYAGTATAPSNGLIVSGQVGIGTNAPNAGAALDVSSSTQGLLMPRMATNPASPTLGMMYINTTTGCLMFYNGSSWQSIICGCPNTPPAPGAIIGSSTFCSGQSGVSYSVAPISVANSYTWTVPTGATVTGGQGSNTVTVTFANTSGNITVSAINNCGTSTATTLGVTLSPTVITGQPTNAFVTGGTGTATFTVTATGASLTYQWQVNSGSGFSNVTNGAPYSNATTAALSVTNPSNSLNGNQYQCVVTGACGTTTSNAATLGVCAMASVPITLTNSQATTTTSGLQVMVTVNSSTFSSNGEDANLDNVEFTTGPGATGTVLNAWIESATVTPPSSSSTATVYWVNLGTTTITNGTPVKIYMNFMPSPVMTSKTSVTGEAPQISSTYGQYDNGAKVFPNVYTAWGGLSGGALPTGISKTGGVTITNNALNTQVTVTGGSGTTNGVFYASTPSSASGTTVMETYADINGTYLWWGTGPGTGDGNGPGIILAWDNGANSVDYIQKASTGNGDLVTTAAIIPNVATIWSISLASNTSLTGILKNYTSVLGAQTIISAASPTYYGYFGTTQNGTSNGSNNSVTIYWTRTRIFPPSGILPTSSVGSYGCN